MDCPDPTRDCPLTGPNGWDRWRGEITETLRHLSNEQEKTQLMVLALRDDLASLKGRAAGVGAAAGFVVTALVELAIHSWRKLP